jgi:predicted nucleic acid-binding protein
VAKTRIVLEVNVYVSGLLWTGIPHLLLQAAESGALGLVTTPAIIEELRNERDDSQGTDAGTDSGAESVGGV